MRRADLRVVGDTIMTAMPAARPGLKVRGRIAAGMKADRVLVPPVR